MCDCVLERNQQVYRPDDRNGATENAGVENAGVA